MEGTTSTLLVVFVFTFIPLILAEIARKRSLPTVEDFFIQSRKMPLIMVFFTVYSTWVSSFAFMGATSYFYLKGPVYMTCFAWNAFFAIMFYFIGERIWYYGKTNGYVSPVDFFKDIYGSKLLCLIVAVTMIVFTIPYLQIQLAGGAYIIETATGGLIPWRISGLIFYLIIIIYLWAGGIRAVALSDIYYGILLFLSMIFVGFYLVYKAGGLTEVYSYLATNENDMMTLTGKEGSSAVTLWISMFFIVPIGAMMGPQMWLRSYSVHKKSTFRIMPFLLCIVTIEYIGPVLSGAAGRVLDPFIENTDMLIPILLLEHAPQFLSALLFCGIAAASLSTANSQIHATAAIYTLYFHKEYINPHATEKKLVSVGKWAVLMVSAFAYLLLIQSSSVMIETGTIALGGTAQLIVPTLGALLWKKSNKHAAILGIVTGLMVLTASVFFTSINSNTFAFIALIANTGVFIVCSLAFREDPIVSSKIATYKETFEKNR